MAEKRFSALRLAAGTAQGAEDNHGHSAVSGTTSRVTKPHRGTAGPR